MFLPTRVNFEVSVFFVLCARFLLYDSWCQRLWILAIVYILYNVPEFADMKFPIFQFKVYEIDRNL